MTANRCVPVLLTVLSLAMGGCAPEPTATEAEEISSQEQDMGGRSWSDKGGIISVRDSALSLTINCRTAGCNLERVAKTRSDGSSVQVMVGTGYWWGASPRGVPDGACGFASGNTYGVPHVNYNVSDEGGGIRVNWSQAVSEYCRDLPVGMRVWGSYWIPWDASVVKVWHAFSVEDPGLLQHRYGTRYLDSFAANLDVTGDFTDLTWPSHLARGSASGENFKDGTFVVIGGDWAQPHVSWGQGGCNGPDRYRSGYGVITRDMRDIRCHPRFGGQDAGLAVQVAATQGPDRASRPYLIMHSPSSDIAIARVLTGHAERRKTMQAMTNALFTSGNSVMSTTISWDWGDGNLELWWPSGYKAPELGPGWYVDTNEELWFGQGSPDSIRHWIRGVHPIQ